MEKGAQSLTVVVVPGTMNIIVTAGKHDYQFRALSQAYLLGLGACHAIQRIVRERRVDEQHRDAIAGRVREGIARKQPSSNGRSSDGSSMHHSLSQARLVMTSLPAARTR
jgi:hypothetical protein